MHTKLIIPETRMFYKHPAMMILTPAASGLRLSFKEEPANNSDYDLLKQFSDNEITKAICIDGIDEGQVMIEVRAFIFAARKYFEQGTRPPILLFTTYTMDELKKKSFSGLEAEMLQYGNCIILTGKIVLMDQKKLFRKYGLDRFHNNLEIYEYTNNQYE